MTEQKGNTPHSVADTGQASEPREDLGIDNKENSVVQGNKQELSSLSRETQEHNHQCHHRDDCNLCHDGVVAIGETKLGIRRSEIGTRSIRLGAAMAMYLSGVPVFSIMLIGRWSSTVFLKYIRKQVQGFLHGISLKMIEVQSFKHVQNQTETNPMENIVGDPFSLLMG
jgi:hypothetical protein